MPLQKAKPGEPSGLADARAKDARIAHLREHPEDAAPGELAEHRAELTRIGDQQRQLAWAFPVCGHVAAEADRLDRALYGRQLLVRSLVRVRPVAARQRGGSGRRRRPGGTRRTRSRSPDDGSGEPEPAGRHSARHPHLANAVGKPATALPIQRAMSSAEQLAALWRRSEAEQTAFFRAVRELVDAREHDIRAEVVG